MLMHLRINHAVLESLLLGVSRVAAARHNAMIREFDFTLTPDKGGRAAFFEARITAGKSVLFLPVSVTINVEGRLLIGDAFDLVVQDLSAGTEGFIGWLANSFGLIESQLAQFEGKRIKLADFFPGLEIQDIQLSSTSRNLSLEVTFQQEEGELD